MVDGVVLGNDFCEKHKVIVLKISNKKFRKKRINFKAIFKISLSFGIIGAISILG